MRKYEEEIDASRILQKLKLKQQNYILVTSHRSENVDKPENLKKLLMVSIE